MNEWIARMRAAYAELAPREQILVASAGGLLALAILYVAVVSPVLGMLDRGGMRRDTAEQELAVMKRLAREHAAIQQQLGDVEERIRQGSRGNLRTTLETLAQRSAVKVESMEPQASPANEVYRETKVAVGLKSVDLPQTVAYLHAIESSPQVLSIKSLRIRSRPDKSTLLDVNFTVSSFEPL
ncbi:MAG: type II secretion system protein GspM [Myxococcota bacterium]